MQRPYNKFDLYPVESPQHPNPAHYRKADNILRDPESFTLIDHGRLVLYEKDMSESKPEEKNHKFIAYIEFTPSEELTQEDVHELNFFTRFLRRAQDFIGTVSSTRIFHGTMWTIGWRKAYIHGKILGRYLDTTSAAQDPDGYKQSIQDGLTAGNIVHRLFNTIADKAVTCANNLLNSLGMPAYQDPNLNLDPSKNGFASNLAFTHGGFSNRPHRDDDTSKTAFLMLCNIKKDTGLISLNSHLDPAFLGPFFVFPDHQVAVDLRKLNGICRIVFDAAQFRHCTHNNQPSHPQLTPFGFSLQITQSCVDAFVRLCNGYYSGRLTDRGEEYFIADRG
ncbi:hypothetical protein PCANC_19857 [Puccinia coronata f. sp. avenae]|uniref:Tet-like 2OG-Fe(II) oxygenase domain-containing protein n=1 Tax=Puccinia coronata f. sp. avenae TaxID=200324 RepID=A0A2N5UC94_9BASI|nr:hypothetical protein PCANC_19857 [Puccinia coronata f. sp. avenae]